MKPCCITDCPSYKKWIKYVEEFSTSISFIISFILVFPLIFYLVVLNDGGDLVAKTYLKIIWAVSSFINIIIIKFIKIEGGSGIAILFGPFMTMFLSMIFFIGKYMRKKRYCS